MPAISRESPRRIDPTDIIRQAIQNKLMRDPAIRQRIDQLKKELKSLKPNNENPETEAAKTIWRRDCLDEIEFLSSFLGRKPSKFGVSDWEIEEAKRYPIDKIIDFSRGTAEAWCHPDKNPSLTHWKDKNLAFCFVCNKAFNSIDVIMDWQCLSFNNAVKQLLK